MSEYKTINQLLRENGNLAYAVQVLIQGCLNKECGAVSEWDKIRRIDEERMGETMKYWTIVYPGEYGQHIKETFSEDQIILSYFEYWRDKMKSVSKEDLISIENCIRDWCIIHWAVETDELGNIV